MISNIVKGGAGLQKGRWGRTMKVWEDCCKLIFLSAWEEGVVNQECQRKRGELGKGGCGPVFAFGERKSRGMIVTRERREDGSINPSDSESFTPILDSGRAQSGVETKILEEHTRLIRAEYW